MKGETVATSDLALTVGQRDGTRLRDDMHESEKRYMVHHRVNVALLQEEPPSQLGFADLVQRLCKEPLRLRWCCRSRVRSIRLGARMRCCLLPLL